MFCHLPCRRTYLGTKTLGDSGKDTSSKVVKTPVVMYLETKTLGACAIHDTHVSPLCKRDRKRTRSIVREHVL